MTRKTLAQQLFNVLSYSWPLVPPVGKQIYAHAGELPAEWHLMSALKICLGGFVLGAEALEPPPPMNAVYNQKPLQWSVSNTES